MVMVVIMMVVTMGMIVALIMIMPMRMVRISAALRIEWRFNRRKTRAQSLQHRFERPIHDTAIAAAYYRDADGKLVFIHTEVPAEFSGQGIATALARGTFELLRQTGRKAELICPFMVHFVNTHPEYKDVVAR